LHHFFNPIAASADCREGGLRLALGQFSINQKKSIKVLGTELVPGCVGDVDSPTYLLQQTSFIDSSNRADAHGGDTLSVSRCVNGECHGVLTDVKRYTDLSGSGSGVMAQLRFVISIPHCIKPWPPAHSIDGAVTSNLRLGTMGFTRQKEELIEF
jgi:hypothetical protein